MRNEAALPAGFFVVCAVAFGGSAAATVEFCRSMAGRMEMPGGWEISMTWVRMPGQSWTASAMMFTLMWLPMMVAMMLPALIPALRQYRTAFWGNGTTALGPLTAVVSAGYFSVWTVFGIVVFAAGAALASIAMRQAAIARDIPLAGGLVVLVAGAIQFTRWKARHLAACRAPGSHCCVLTPNAGTAWRHGLRLGLECSRCCLGLMVVLLVIGVMDLRAVTAVTAAISAERLLPNGEQVARALGYVVVGGGLLLIVRAAGLA